MLFDGYAESAGDKCKPDGPIALIDSLGVSNEPPDDVSNPAAHADFTFTINYLNHVSNIS